MPLRRYEDAEGAVSGARPPRGPKPEITAGAVAWAYARHYWREVLVLEISGRQRDKVVVAYRLNLSGNLRKQKLLLWNLRAQRPTNANWHTLSVVAPTLAEVEAAAPAVEG